MKFQVYKEQINLTLPMHRVVIQNVLLVRGASLSFSAAASIKPIQLHLNTTLYNSRLDSR